MRAIVAKSYWLRIWGLSMRTMLGMITSLNSSRSLLERAFVDLMAPSAQVDPEAMRRSNRTFGNGGLFSFNGCFRNAALGANLEDVHCVDSSGGT